MLISPQNLRQNLQKVRERIAQAATRYGRNADSITLVGVSKTQPAEAIASAAQAGLIDVGENYVQEAFPKIAALGTGSIPGTAALTWHFIGRLQANKTRNVAEAFAWVHSVERLGLAERLSRQRAPEAPALNICLQVNIGREPSKGGADPKEVPALVEAIAALPRLKLRGLMCIAPEEQDFARQRHWFAQMRELFERVNAQGAQLDTLSMGMSGDLEAAIAEGATLVRVGTALFGPRSGGAAPDEPLQSAPL